MILESKGKDQFFPHHLLSESVSIFVRACFMLFLCNIQNAIKNVAHSLATLGNETTSKGFRMYQRPVAILRTQH
jgi:hypothetical protein